MTDYFQRDYDELKEIETSLNSDLKKRKEITNNTENTVILEQQIFKKIDELGKKVDGALKGYKSKYNNTKTISDIEANKRINMLNELSKSHQSAKKAYDQIINDKYQYVSKEKFNFKFRNMICQSTKDIMKKRIFKIKIPVKLWINTKVS